MTRPPVLATIAAAVILGAGAAVVAQRDFSKVEIVTQQVAPGVAMLTGAGGNIGVSSGPDGILLIDDQYAPLSDKIRAAVKQISDRPIRFVLNTHWHGDHVGGNEALATAGAVIVAHDNVRRRMSSEQFIAGMNRKIDPSPAAALPIITFTDSLTFHWNGDDLVAWHVPHAHTDGDVMVLFRKANVLHMGDCFFTAGYPRIDVSSGGSIGGMIAAADLVLARMGPDTQLIPGHGVLSNKSGLEKYRTMLVSVRDAVARLAAAGKSLEEIKAAKPTAPFDAEWGTSFIKPDQFVEFVFAGIKG